MCFTRIPVGDTSCSAHMQQLHRRHRQEREVLLSTLKLDNSLTINQAMLVEYTRLSRQLTIMEEENGFVAITTAVGLAERAMEPRTDR